jgi:hypothetical protein
VCPFASNTVAYVPTALVTTGARLGKMPVPLNVIVAPATPRPVMLSVNVPDTFNTSTLIPHVELLFLILLYNYGKKVRTVR